MTWSTRSASDRLVDGVKWEYWGAWKGKQYVIPAHHQPHLLLVRMDIAKELGLKDPDTWDWNDLLNAARTISQKKPDMAGFCMALGRNLCTDYHFAALLHSAGGRMFAQANKFEVAFDSPQTVEALDIRQGAAALHAEGRGRIQLPAGGRRARHRADGDELLLGPHARPRGRGGQAGVRGDRGVQPRRASDDRPALQLERLPGLVHPGAEQPVHRRGEAGARLSADQQGMAGQVLPLADAERGAGLQGRRRRAGAQEPSVLQVQAATVDTYFKTSLANSSSTANELLQGVNPLAGIVHGRSVLAQTVQKVVIDKMEPRDAAKWGAQGAERHPPGEHPPARLSLKSARAGPPARTAHGDAMRKRLALSDRAVGVLFIVPFVLAALFFMVYPIVEAVRMAFYSYNPLRPDLSTFVGLANFAYIFADPLFWSSFWQATVWTGLSIFFQTVLGVAHRASAAPAARRDRGLSRPAAVSLHRADGGDRADLALDLQSRDRRRELCAVEQRRDHRSRSTGSPRPTMAMASTIMLNVWKYTPFVVICVLARLQSVPLELYDAAKVDGAGVIRRFLDVTLPQLKEVLIVVVVFRTIWTFNKFEEIYLLTKGGPGTSTFNLAVYSFEQSIANLQARRRRRDRRDHDADAVGRQHHLPARAGFAREERSRHDRRRLLAGIRPCSRSSPRCAAVTFVVCFPLIWALSTSLKPKSEIFATPPTLIPQSRDVRELRRAGDRPAAIFPVRRPAGRQRHDAGAILHALVLQQRHRDARARR